jgi:tetratricopeptide (TPR) repeat protein
MSKLCVLFTLLTVSLVVKASCFSLPDQRKAAVNETMKLMLECDFDSAFSMCDSLSASDRADPMAGMLKLSAMGFLDLDCNHASDSVRFFEQLARTESMVFAYETKNGVSSYSLTIKGFARAIAACYFLWHKSYIKGLNAGFDALGILKEAKKRDAANYDVDLFLGLYNYARADMKRMFWWAFFWYPGDRESGIRSLVLCRKNGQFTQSVAALVLAELSIREKRFQEAGKIIAELEHDFPKSRLTRWTRAKYFEEQKLSPQAAETYGGLADEYDTIPAGRRNALAARWKEAVSWDSAGDRKQAEKACEKIVSVKNDLWQRQDPSSRQIVRDAEKLAEKLLDKKKYSR